MGGLLWCDRRKQEGKDKLEKDVLRAQPLRTLGTTRTAPRLTHRRAGGHDSRARVEAWLQG